MSNESYQDYSEMDPPCCTECFYAAIPGPGEDHAEVTCRHVAGAAPIRVLAHKVTLVGGAEGLAMGWLKLVA